MTKAERWIIITYLLGMLFTNAYCQVYRGDDWREPTRPDGVITLNPDGPAIFLTGAATIAWPVYWVSKGAIWVVSNPPCFGCDRPSPME